MDRFGKFNDIFNAPVAYPDFTLGLNREVPMVPIMKHFKQRDVAPATHPNRQKDNYPSPIVDFLCPA